MTQTDVAELRGALAGGLLLPTDDGYDDARLLWNGVIDRRPAIIARCRNVSDVQACVAFAAARDMALAVRGGGHNVAGTASTDGGLVVDLSAMRAIEVFPTTGLVRAAGGATLGDVDAATQAHGLAVPVGVVSETGIAGLTLSGGMGWLRRKHGLSCDNLLAAEVVLADGTLVRASENEHADLLWALRGGGGNFGVVTSFELQAFPVGPEVAYVLALYPGHLAPQVLRGCERYVGEVGDDVSPLAFLGRVPAAEPFPVHAHGEPFVAVAAVHPGDAAAGERTLQPLQALGDILVDLSGRVPYVEAQRLLDEEYPNGRRYYWKSTNLTSLSDPVIAMLMGQAAAAPSDLSTIDVWYQGGAMSRVPPDATAFGDRSAPILIGVEANWEGAEHDAPNIDWARACVAELAPFSTGASYLNFPGFLEDAEQLVRRAHGANYERLAQLKARYDPRNLFRLNQNIAPAPRPPSPL